MCIDTKCFRCGFSFESPFHAVWGCPGVRTVWKLVGLGRYIDVNDEGDVQRMLIRLQWLLSMNDFDLFLVVF